MRRAAAATAAVALLLAGCSEPTPDPSEPTSSAPTPAATTPTSQTPGTPSAPTESPTSASSTPESSPTSSRSEPDDSPSGTATPTEDPLPDETESVQHPWLTAASEQEPRQTTPDAWQEITGVRTGLHDDYDRVVLDLTGDEPLLGWFAGFTDEAIEDPTGLPMEVEGDAFLQLGVWSIDWSTPRPERYSGETVKDEDLENVTEVVFGGLFEAQQQVVIGLEEETAYRIFTLSDPARIVIDVQHD